MERFIIFVPALFIFVGVLLNFAWLYHLLLPSEVIPLPLSRSCETIFNVLTVWVSD